MSHRTASVGILLVTCQKRHIVCQTHRHTDMQTHRHARAHTHTHTQHSPPEVTCTLAVKPRNHPQTRPPTHPHTPDFALGRASLFLHGMQREFDTFKGVTCTSAYVSIRQHTSAYVGMQRALDSLKVSTEGYVLVCAHIYSSMRTHI
jgi:hypothetical protein